MGDSTLPLPDTFTDRLFYTSFSFSVYCDLEACRRSLDAFGQSADVLGLRQRLQVNLVPLNEEVLRFHVSANGWLTLECEVMGQLQQLENGFLAVYGESRITATSYKLFAQYLLALLALPIMGALLWGGFQSIPLIWPFGGVLVLYIASVFQIMGMRRNLTDHVLRILR